MYKLSDSTLQPHSLNPFSPTQAYFYTELDIPDLKKASIQHIKASLTPQNVMQEIFSAFASTHNEIYKAELEYVQSHWVGRQRFPS